MAADNISVPAVEIWVFMPAGSCLRRLSFCSATNSRAAAKNLRRRSGLVAIDRNDSPIDSVAVTAAIIHFIMWGACEVECTVRWCESGSTSIRMPRVSIGWLVSR